MERRKDGEPKTKSLGFSLLGPLAFFLKGGNNILIGLLLRSKVKS